jgi:hypothetical protein
MLQSALIGLGLKAMVAQSTDLSTKANQPLYKLPIGTSYGSNIQHASCILGLSADLVYMSNHMYTIIYNDCRLIFNYFSIFLILNKLCLKLLNTLLAE